MQVTPQWASQMHVSRWPEILPLLPPDWLDKALAPPLALLASPPPAVLLPATTQVGDLWV
jgi:hypothetical protein